MRDQLETGLQVVERFMERRALMVLSEKSQSLAAFQRRIITDCTSRFEACDLKRMHHLGCRDFSKLGRLSMVDIKEAAEWSKSILLLNDEHSNLQQFCLFSPFVVHIHVSKSNISYAYAARVIKFRVAGMIIAIAPLLASDSILGGLRGEMRRIEDKFLDLGMEMKTVAIPFNVDQLHGNRTFGCSSSMIFEFHNVWLFLVTAIMLSSANMLCQTHLRTFPQSLPAWMIVLDSALGCRQGTLWKAPRGSDRPLQDPNNFCRNDFWTYGGCKATMPLQPSKLVSTAAQQ